MKLKHFFLLVISLITAYMFAQADSTSSKQSKHHKKWLSVLTDTTVSNESYYETDILYYDDHIYRNTIHTVQLYDSSFQLSSPIIQLGTSQQLKLSFDDFDGGVKAYNYTLIHCDRNWNPSDLSTADYMTGIGNDFVNDSKYSINSTQHYTHYNVIFPNEYNLITKSGNYIIKVYQDNNPDKIILTKRFFVYDQKITINAVVKPATTVSDRNYKQEIDFTIDHSDYDIANPYDNLKVVIAQNGRRDNAISNLKPKYVKENIFDYDYDEENVFTGGNEFRNFDLKTLRFQTMRIQKISYDSAHNHAWLTPDEKRTFKRYTSLQDINGRYLVKMNEANNSECEADYVYVHFFLANNELFTDGDIYILGGLSDWQFKKEFKMNYNAERKGYEATIYLKQGYYNYEYVFLKDGETVGDETVIEGMHFETENDYTVFVYYREQGINYDQLIGVKHFNSSVRK